MLSLGCVVSAPAAMGGPSPVGGSRPVPSHRPSDQDFNLDRHVFRPDVLSIDEASTNMSRPLFGSSAVTTWTY